MDIFFPYTFRERSAFKGSAIKIGFAEALAESTANAGVLDADERMSILIIAWKNINNYLTHRPFNQDVGITVNWVVRMTLDLWFGRDWIACAAENKTALIEQMMKVYPSAFITLDPYSWPYMFSIHRDPWMVEYLNINFQRMSGPDLTPVLEPRDSEFIQQEGIPLLLLRMVNMFDFRMVKLVKYMCLRVLLTWQDGESPAGRSLRASPKADQYIDYARHIYLVAICESNGLKDLHYTLETIQRVEHCDTTKTGSLELGAYAIAKGLQETNKTLTELLIAFLFKIPKLQFVNIFGEALSKYINFLTEYQLRKLCSLSSVKLSWPHEEVYSKLVQIFISHRESSEALIKATPKTSEQVFSGVHNLTASKCAYDLIKLRPHPEWHTTKITLLLIIISGEINIIQDYKYNDVQSTDELIEKEREVSIYYRDLAKLFHKTPYLEQEAWLTTFSLHPCREFMDAVTRCGARNLRAIKKQAHKLKVIEAPEPKGKIKEDTIKPVNDGEKIPPQKEIVQNVFNTTFDLNLPNSSDAFVKTLETAASALDQDPSKPVSKPKPKRAPRKKPDKNGPKKIEPKIKEEPNKNKASELINKLLEENETAEKSAIPIKRGRPVGAINKTPRPRPTNPVIRKPAKKSDEKPDLAEEVFAAAAGAADNITNQTEKTIKYPAFALMNSVTDTEDLMKFTNYDESYQQYEELNRILSSIKLNYTCHEDLLALLIAPRYKRLTWAVSWKKLKKRCRVILTKENKKRELVEQSMADANDRLTHLNIDYEKYKDKPQIDYGTIEGGYECFDVSDSEEDDLKTANGDYKMQIEGLVSKKKGKRLVDASKSSLKLDAPQITNIDIKPLLKIENFDSATSKLFNIIDSTHLSKPVYLNKPVYFVRNPLASPLSETAISLETGPEIKSSIGTCSNRSIGEDTATSESLEEHHWSLATTNTLNQIMPEIRRKSQEQEANFTQFKATSLHSRSLFKTEQTFNIPASIRQQLEQPSMFFQSSLKIGTNAAEINFTKEEYNDLKEKQKPQSPPKISQNHDYSSTFNQIDQTITDITRFSPKLFEDIPEDLTMRKGANNEAHENNAATETFPQNLTSNFVIDDKEDFKEPNPVAEPSKIVTQPKLKPLKRGIRQPPRSLTKINSRKRQPKEDVDSLPKKDPSDLNIECPNTQPSDSLTKVRIMPQNKNSKKRIINQTAAVVFSSAAATYHRTPYLNAAHQQPNILQQLLSKEVIGNDQMIDKTKCSGDEDTGLKRRGERGSALKFDAKLRRITHDPRAHPDKSFTKSTLEVQQIPSISSLSSAGTETINSKTNVISTTQSTNKEFSKFSSVSEIMKDFSSSNFVCDDNSKPSSIYEKKKKFESIQNAQRGTLTCSTLKTSLNDSKDPEQQQNASCFTLINSLGAWETKNFLTAGEYLDAENINDVSKRDSSDGEWPPNNVQLFDSKVDDLIVNDNDKSEYINVSNTIRETKMYKATQNHSQTIEATLTNKKDLKDFQFKVPAAVVKPCLFMNSKRVKKVNSYVSDWVKNIKFFDKTAVIAIPVGEQEKVPNTKYNSNSMMVMDNDINKTLYEVNTILNKTKDGLRMKLTAVDVSMPTVSQNFSDDILYDNHIVFNTKLLDPHLKTYRNTKAPLKATDAKKSDQHILEPCGLFSGKSDEPVVVLSEPVSSSLSVNIQNQGTTENNENIAFDHSISSVQSEHSMSDSLLRQSTSSPERQLPSPIASTSQEFVHTTRTFVGSDLQKVEHLPLKAKKIRNKSKPSTKRLDKMCGWIERITRASREPMPESSKTATLINVFAAQLMNKAKSYHFNNEYQQERNKFISAASAPCKRSRCEASILMASPGPSADCVKLIKAFKKKSLFKGLDMGSDDISFTSYLAKELLGTVVKVTINEKQTSCSGDNFDASDALDEFTRSRQDAHSPTFYSPTLSIKHLRNGTLADSFGFIDTSLEERLKTRRKRGSLAKDLPETSLQVRKRTINLHKIASKIRSELNSQSSDRSNPLTLKEICCSKYPTLKKLSAQKNTFTDCSKIPVKKKRIRKRKIFETEISKEYSKQQSVDEANKLLLKPSGRPNNRDVLNKLPIEEHIWKGCSAMKSSSDKAIQLPETTKSKVNLSPIENTNGNISQLVTGNTKTAVCSNAKNSFDTVSLQPAIEQNVSLLCLVQNDSSEMAHRLGNYLNSHEAETKKESTGRTPMNENPIGSSFDSNESLKSKLKRTPYIKKHAPFKTIRAEPIQTERKSKTRQRTSRHTFSEAKYLQEEQTSNLRDTMIQSETKKPLREYLGEEQTSNQIREKEKSETADIFPLEETKQFLESETKNFMIQHSLQKVNKLPPVDESIQVAINPNEIEASPIQHSPEYENIFSVPNKTKTLPGESKEFLNEKNNSPLQNKMYIVEETNELAVDKRQTLYLQRNDSFKEQDQLPVEDTKQFHESCATVSPQILIASEKEAKLPVLEEITRLTEGTREVKACDEQGNHLPVSKKRTAKPRISYVEYDSDEDEPLRSRLKIPSLKINLPAIRPSRRRKVLKQSLPKKRTSTKSTPRKRSSHENKKILESKEKKTASKFLKTNFSSNCNESDDDKPLSTQLNKPYPKIEEDEKELPIKETNFAENKLRRSSRALGEFEAVYQPIIDLDESEDDHPLKKLTKKSPFKKKTSSVSMPSLKIKKGPNKLALRKKHIVGYSPRRPSLRLQSKLTRRRSSATNYFALFLSDSDEDESAKRSKRNSTTDKLWPVRNRVRAAPKEPAKNTNTKRKRRYKRVVIRPNRTTKPKVQTPIMEMPILTREDSDQTDQDNIYECATVSTANETDEDASSDPPPKRRRLKVVKPMRIRCVSRRVIPTDVLTESSSCSSTGTVQTVRKLTISSMPDFTKKGRTLKQPTLIKRLLMEKLQNESSSGSSPVMMNKRRRQFAAKSTSKPSIIKDQVFGMVKQTPTRKCVLAANARRAQQLSYIDKEAIQSHNCVNIEVRLQKLTVNEAILCRKPLVRLDKNFVDSYYATKTLKSKEDTQLETAI